MGRTAYGHSAKPLAQCCIASGGNTGVESAPVTDVLAQEDVRNLLEAVHAVGSIGAEALALALDELDLEPAELDEFHRALDDLKVEVTTEEADEPDLDASHAMSTDALEIFLKDIGKVELLTAA